MNSRDVEDRPRDSYVAADVPLDQDPARDDAAHDQTRRRVRWAAPVAARLAVAAGTGVVIFAAAGCGSQGHPSGAQRSPGQSAAFVRPASGSPAIGAPYPYKLFIHCGVPPVSFGGRDWQPVQPVPKYPGARPVNGITTETGYVAGTMTLVDAHTLRFTADPHAVLAPFTVVFRRATASSAARPCA